MEIFVRREALPEQLGAEHLAVLALDQAAVGLVGEAAWPTP